MIKRGTALAITVVFVLSVFGAAQIRDRTPQAQSGSDSNQAKINAKKSKRGPRAIAVLEFLPGGSARLVPVALWINDRFYDASLYGADPEPMALQPETVYEATNYGEPTGLFTVTTPEQVKGSWIAAGQWKPHFAADDKMLPSAANQPKPPHSSNPLDERPTLRRPGSSGSSSSGSTGQPQTSSSGASATSSGGDISPSPNEPPDRPTLKKPASETPAPQSSPPSQGQPAANPSAASTSAASPDEGDPNRPILRRGSPAPSTTAAKANPPGTTTAKANQAPAAIPMAEPKTSEPARAGHHSYPAISDAGPYETRSLLYAMNSAEREDKSAQLRGLALDEIHKFVSKRNTPGLPANASITDFDLRAFDLDYSNSPTFVFTAALPLPTAKAFRGGEFKYYVELVAHEDINGTPIVIFKSVTDSNHLDAFSRMEIIDAVDADANGRGDLLFREYSDTGISYSLYRVYPYEMRKVFEGGASM